MMTKLYDLVKKLFEQYMVEYPVSIETCGSNMIPSNVATSEANGESFEEDDWKNQFRFNMRIKQDEVQRN
ncbi:unnamed protein product [Lathyrus sativus]|nr:unnamed protein product [Lathyrus sativus]